MVKVLVEEAAYAIATAYHITGYPDGTLKPQGNLTRAEAVGVEEFLAKDLTMVQDIDLLAGTPSV